MTDQIFILLLVMVVAAGAVTIAYYWLCSKRLTSSQEHRELQKKLDEANERIQKQSLRIARLRTNSRFDSLTQLPNEHALNEELIRRSSEVARYNVSACILLVDVDQFESFNARHGSEIGDVVLQHLAETVRSQVRVCDFGARFEGRGRFAVVLSHTGINFARPVADRLQKSVEGVEFQLDGGPSVEVTVSIGVAELGDDVPWSMSVAEEALAKAKATGKNKIVILDPQVKSMIH